MSEGWVKLHRQFKSWEWYDSPTHVSFFLHCLLSANHKKKNWRGVTINPGEFVTSHTKLAKQTGMTVRQVRKRIDDLKMTGELATKTSNQHTRIIILNWARYQVDDEQKGARTSIKGQSKGNQRATNKNDNNANNEKECEYAPDDLVQLWNEQMTSSGFKSTVSINSYEHIENFKIVSANVQTLDAWQGIFQKCKDSPFLRGERNGRRVNLTWLLKWDNTLKVLNGNYDDEQKESGYQRALREAMENEK